MEFTKWTDIEAFHNIRKAVCQYPHLIGETNQVVYRAKVKLHGTCAAVVVSSEGEVKSQSRTNFVSTSHDNAGFATWVLSQEDIWRQAKSVLKEGQEQIVIFGEWSGPGVQKGVAINQIPNKIMAVFAVQILPGDELIVDPEEIKNLLPKVQQTYVLPWYGSETKVPWLIEAEKLQPIVDGINQMVSEVERCDPWVKDNFGVEGLGEGLVFYPISHPGRKSFGELCFKAKGEKHKVVNAKAPAQISPESAAHADAFAALVLTDARLEQGARAVSDGELVFDMKNTGKFIGWISQDVSKETQDELEASGLDWKSVNKVLCERARLWYINKAKEIK